MTDALRDWLRDMHEGCESPIESMLASALMYVIGLEMFERADCQPGNAVQALVMMETQWKCGSYRIDIALMGSPGVRVAIECDGHEFHEKTKRQAARDKSRDRALAVEGWTVLRFTGSEIWSNPFSCAHEAMDVVNQLESRGAEIAYMASRTAPKDQPA